MTERAQDLAAMMNRGRAHVAAGELAAAIAVFTEVLELAPLYPTGYLDRGTARLMAEEVAAAIVDLDTAIALLPPGAPRSVAYCNRGLAHELTQQRALAVRDLRLALAGGWEPAQAELDHLGADASPSAPDPDAAAACCAEGRARFAQAPLVALGRFHRATDLAPALSDGWHGLGVVNVALGRRAEAIAAFDRVLALASVRAEQRAEALFDRGQLRADAGDLPGAIADFEACLALCRDDQVGFPDFGDPAKEAQFVDFLAGALARAKQGQDPGS